MEETSSIKEDGSDSEPQFEYQPLSPPSKTIRIIKLLPGSPSDPLECELEHSPIDSTDRYEAISYVWGEKKDFVRLLCEGKSLRIPRSLYDALLQLRCPSKPRKLWADAICINQDKDSEKNHQVPLMRTIFRRADKVLIWLGHDGAELAECAFGFARRLSDKTSTKLLPDTSTWHSFSVMLMQPWFWRIWCFQEIVLARKAEVMWGEARIDWEPLGRVATWIGSTGYDVMQNFPFHGVYNASLMYTLSRSLTGADPASFLHLLMVTRRFKCTRSVDRIYALLGIKTSDTDPDEGNFYMVPDYAKDKEDVYEEFAVRIMNTSRDMTLLSAVQHGPHLSESTKSWVPQWDKSYTRTVVSAHAPGMKFSASRHLEQSPPSFHDSTLIVHGLEVDIVDRISEMTPERRVLASEHWRIQELWTAMAAPLQSYPNRQSLAVAFCWALTAGKDWLGNSVQDEASHLADFAAFVQQNFDSEIREFLEIPDVLIHGSDSGKGDAGRYTEAMYYCFCLRRFFVTKNGYIGIGPACMQEGDKVCVLSGAIIPFIIRPDGDQHKLVGEAYVHGIMRGEACERHENESVELSTFRLT
ncbi:Heterokaryon incompatibility protein [Lasiodiplodia theobromae]|uniref:Heterokaryon incompatibility protein n=1 Tax=Lasiodiplodia theobromae TaxID=45133 RepID=UPI0015C3A5FB|nr:Heterokaryon incompatibility protein [Lasiodiplodia theobromae]KAF4543274.1 Heterokaryon incompatibility protein [Lasiodiplodia theobromae]